MQIIILFLYIIGKHLKNNELEIVTKERSAIPYRYIKLHKIKHKLVKNVPHLRILDEAELYNNDINKPFIFKRIIIRNSDLKSFMKKELNHIMPAIYKNLELNFRNRNIDFEKYRDLIFLKRKQYVKNNKQIIEYDITEKLIPKNVNNKNSKHSYFIMFSIFTCLIGFLSIIIYLCVFYRNKFLDMLYKTKSTYKI